MTTLKGQLRRPEHIGITGYDEGTDDFNAAAVNSAGLLKVAGYVWSTELLDWVPGAPGGGSGVIVNPDGTGERETILLDETATELYVGKAPRGTATSAAEWLISKVTDGGVTWASNTYNQVWDDRAGLTYE